MGEMGKIWFWMSTYFPHEIPKDSELNQEENVARETAELHNYVIKANPSEDETDKKALYSN